MGRTKSKERAHDKEYANALNKLVDRLFEIASHNKGWTWEQMAYESGLSASTISKLGRRETKYPQHRTVELLAQALGGRLDYVKDKFSASGRTVKLRIWDFSAKKIGFRRSKKKAA